MSAPCASHQLWFVTFRATSVERLARAPSRRHPTPPCPWPPDPPRGRRLLDLEDAVLEPLTTLTPCEARWRTRPSRSTPSSPVAGWTPTRVTFATRAG